MSLGSTEPVPFVVAVGLFREATVVAVAGELDLHTAAELESTLGEVGHNGRIVVDLSQVTFLDSTALGVLLRASSRRAHDPLDLVVDGSEVRRVFEITGLERRFTFARSVEAALER
jgi:anti-sigma B factor antagonist